MLEPPLGIGRTHMCECRSLAGRGEHLMILVVSLLRIVEISGDKASAFGAIRQVEKDNPFNIINTSQTQYRAPSSPTCRTRVCTYTGGPHLRSSCLSIYIIRAALLLSTGRPSFKHTEHCHRRGARPTTKLDCGEGQCISHFADSTPSDTRIALRVSK